MAHENETQCKKIKPSNETEAIADIIKRVDEIKAELQAEYAKIDKLQQL